MAEATSYVFDHKEIAEALIKHQGLHEGIWGVYIEFALQAANVSTGPTEEDLLPAAIVPVMKLGIQKFPKINKLSVDAAVVNPPVKKPSELSETRKLRKRNTA